MKTTWCPHCYRTGCMHCNGTGFIQVPEKDDRPAPKAGHPEPEKHPISKWEAEDKVFEAAHRRWEKSWAKRKKGMSFEEFLKMDI